MFTWYHGIMMNGTKWHTVAEGYRLVKGGKVDW